MKKELKYWLLAIGNFLHVISAENRNWFFIRHKMRQLKNKKPSGIKIDMDALNNVDLGNGTSVSWQDILAKYNSIEQFGDNKVIGGQ